VIANCFLCDSFAVFCSAVHRRFTDITVLFSDNAQHYRWTDGHTTSSRQSDHTAMQYNQLKAIAILFIVFLCQILFFSHSTHNSNWLVML